MKRIVGYFLKGLLFLVPVAVTVGVLYYVVNMIDRLFAKLIPGLESPFPGTGLLVTLVLVTFIGFLASNLITNKLLGVVDWIFTKLPLVKLLYSSVKDMIGAFVGEQKSFNRPVVVSLSANGPKILGFLTNEDLTPFGLADHVAVYFPQSYNFAGNLFVFPKEQVTRIETESSQVMTFLVSGGVSGKK